MGVNKRVPELPELLRPLAMEDLFLVSGFAENKDFSKTYEDFLADIGGYLAGSGLSLVDGKIKLGDGVGVNYTAPTSYTDEFDEPANNLDAAFTINGLLNWEYFKNDDIFYSYGISQITGSGASRQFASTDLVGLSDSNHTSQVYKRVTPTIVQATLAALSSISEYRSAFLDLQSTPDDAVAGFFVEKETIDGFKEMGIYLRTASGAVQGMRIADSFLEKGLYYEGDYEANFVDRSLVTKQYVDGLVAGADPYADYLTFTPGIDLWQVGFANDYLQFFEGIFSFVINTGTAMSFSESQISWMIATGALNIDSDGFTIEEGNGKFIYDGVADYFIWQLGAAGNQMILDFDTVNSRLDFLSSAPVLAYNFDKPVMVDGEELLGETGVSGVVAAEVDLYNTEQLGQDFEGKTEIKGLRRAKTGTSITFKNPISTYGSLDAPITTMTISDLTGAIPFNKSYVFIQSLSVPAMIADEVANGGLTTIIPTGTFNTASNAINIVELEYINDSFVTAKMQSILVGDPIDSSIFLLLNYDENKNLTIDNSLDNSSLYPDDVEPFVLNAGDASYTLVSGANYDLETGVNASALSRAQHQASVSIASKSAFTAGTNIASTSTNSVGTGSKVFTYTSTLNLTWIEGVTRVRARSGANWVEGVATVVSTTSVTINVDTTGGSGSFSSWVLNEVDRGITIIRGFRKTSTTSMSMASNQDDAATSGVRFAIGSAGTITVRINGVNATVASGIDQTNMFWFAMTYNLATGETKVSRKSPGAGFSFSTILTSSAHLSEALNFGGTADLWWFERNNFGSSTPQGVTNRLTYISSRILSDAEIEALMV